MKTSKLKEHKEHFISPLSYNYSVVITFFNAFIKMLIKNKFEKKPRNMTSHIAAVKKFIIEFIIEFLINLFRKK